MRQVELVNEETDLVLKLNVKDQWSEVMLGEYLEMMSIFESKEGLTDDDFLVKLLCIVSDVDKDQVLDIPITEFDKLVDIFTEFSKLDMEYQVEDFYIIGNTIFVPKKNLTNLTLSEKIYIDNMSRDNKDVMDIYLSILSIILRPGYKKEEDGKVKYIMNKLEADDIEERKKLFKMSLTASISIPLIKAFMSGTKG